MRGVEATTGGGVEGSPPFGCTLPAPPADPTGTVPPILRVVYLQLAPDTRFRRRSQESLSPPTHQPSSTTIRNIDIICNKLRKGQQNQGENMSGFNFHSRQ